MKQCPKCQSTYTDDGLRFCLTDGSRLTDIPDENETQVAGRGATVRVDTSGRPDPSIGNVGPPRSSTGKVILIGGIVGLLLIVVIGLVGVLVYFGAYFGFRNTTTTENSVTNKPAVSTPTTTPTPDSERQRLQDELANIQKRLDEQQKNADRPPASRPAPNSPEIVTARVNSPNDGFLALRAQPDAKGDLIVKIPHGDTVTIENCDRGKVAIGGRTGRWCLVSWSGYQGYVFDAWLIY